MKKIVMFVEDVPDNQLLFYDYNHPHAQRKEFLLNDKNNNVTEIPNNTNQIQTIPNNSDMTILDDLGIDFIDQAQIKGNPHLKEAHEQNIAITTDGFFVSNGNDCTFVSKSLVDKINKQAIDYYSKHDPDSTF